MQPWRCKDYINVVDGEKDSNVVFYCGVNNLDIKYVVPISIQQIEGTHNKDFFDYER